MAKCVPYNIEGPLMDSDESVHNESEFYYPGEETPNETKLKKSEKNNAPPPPLSMY